jgi:ABC-type glycerol-3-phosphate transport system substrate-binding protein
MVFGAGASQAEKPAETKELLIWSHWGNEPGKRAWIDEVVAEYQAANPNIRFKIEWYGDKNDLYTQLNAANQAGGRNAPDIHTIDFRPYGGIPQEQNGWLLDLAKGLNKDHWDPNLLSAASYGNAIWGIPLESFGIWVWYDKNLFAKWGLQVPADGKMSWELFQQIRAKAVENNMLVFSQGVQNLPIFASHFPTSFLINHAGVDLVREAVIKGTRPYNDPAMVRGLQAGVDLIPQLFNADVATLVLFQGAGLFFNGKAALTLEGSFLTSWLGLVQKDGAAPASLDLGIMRFPVIPGGSGTSVIQSGAGSGWAASAFTKHADVVIDFFNFISTPARGSRWIELSQVTTGIKANIPASASELIRNQAKWLQEGPAISPALYQVPGGDEAVYWTQGMTRFFVDRNYTAKEFLDEMQRLRERRK